MEALAILAVLYLLIAPALGIAAFARHGKLRGEIRELRKRLMATVAKVFLIDMSELTDLYRVASFFGLGLSLIGIGYLYQRYVFPSPAKGSGAQPHEASAG